MSSEVTETWTCLTGTAVRGVAGTGESFLSGVVEGAGLVVWDGDDCKEGWEILLGVGLACLWGCAPAFLVPTALELCCCAFELALCCCALALALAQRGSRKSNGRQRMTRNNRMR